MKKKIEEHKFQKIRIPESPVQRNPSNSRKNSFLIHLHQKYIENALQSTYRYTHG